MSYTDTVAGLLSAVGIARVALRAGPLIVMYHGIGGEDGVDPGELRRQLTLLKASRRVLPLREAVATLGTMRASETAAITFDDGYLDFLEQAVPVLSECCLHSTVFVPADKLGKYNDWDSGRAPRRALMDAAQLRGLPSEIVEVGVHGFGHVRMNGLEPEALERETSVARRVLEDGAGRGVTLFAYPYGQLDDFDADAERAVRRAGFEAACSTHFGRGSLPSERFRLRRVAVECTDTLEVFRHKLEGAYDWIAWRARLGARLRAHRSR